jgi:hypothetical protein
VDIHIDEAKQIARIKLTGMLSRNMILRAFDAAISHERYKPGMGRLWDFRTADLSALDSGTIAEMARYSIKFPPGVNDVKVAFVAGRELEYGLSRMFEFFSEDAAETTIAVFYSIDEAEQWLTT